VQDYSLFIFCGDLAISVIAIVIVIDDERKGR